MTVRLPGAIALSFGIVAVGALVSVLLWTTSHLRVGWELRSIPNPRNKQSASIIRTSLLPPEVCRCRERFGETLLWSRIGVEDLGSPRLALVHDARILEFFNQSFLSSTTRMANVNYRATDVSEKKRTGSWHSSSAAPFHWKTSS